MIPMAVIPLVGAGIIALAIVIILHRSSLRRRATKADFDQVVQDKIRKAKILDTKLAQDVLSGADLDGAIDDFQKARAFVHAVPTDTPWLWDVEELQKWATAQLESQINAINSKARLAALSVIITVALAVIGIDATLYSYLSTPQPMLSPQGPPRRAGLPSAVPLPAPSGPTPNP